MCPVFTPTMQEFTKYTFMEYLAAAEEMLGPNIGVYKVSCFNINDAFNTLNFASRLSLLMDGPPEMAPMTTTTQRLRVSLFHFMSWDYSSMVIINLLRCHLFLA